MSYDQAERLRKQVSPKPQARTIAVCSGKGGVGKSNFTLNFAIRLARNNYRVLLFDLDIGMGNIDLLLGMQTTYSIADVLSNRISIHDAIVASDYGVEYIPGGSGLSDFMEIDRHKKAVFYQELASVMERYDYVLFDMGAGVNETALFFILAADECFIVTTPEPTSITDAYGIIKHILLNQAEMPIYTILNRVKSKKDAENILTNFHEVIKRFLSGDTQSLGAIPDDNHVAKAVMHQKPYTILYPKTKASQAIEEIRQNYIGKGNRQKPGSFIDRIIRLIER